MLSILFRRSITFFFESKDAFIFFNVTACQSGNVSEMKQNFE